MVSTIRAKLKKLHQMAEALSLYWPSESRKSCSRKCHPLQPGFQAVANTMFPIKQLTPQVQLLQELPGTPENSLGVPPTANLPTQIPGGSIISPTGSREIHDNYLNRSKVICDEPNQAYNNSVLQDNGYSFQDINKATKARFTNKNDMKRDKIGSIYIHTTNLKYYWPHIQAEEKKKTFSQFRKHLTKWHVLQVQQGKDTDDKK